MTFAITRIALFVALLIFGLLWAGKRRKQRKRAEILAVLFAIVITTVSGLFPPENIFLSFSSPQDAFHYSHTAETVLTVEGEESTLVIGQKAESQYTSAILPKSQDKWKIGIPLFIKNTRRAAPGDISVSVSRYGNSVDCYIEIYSLTGAPLEVADAQGAVFTALKTTAKEPFYTYYAVIPRWNEAYLLTVNGEAIELPPVQ